MSKLKHKCEYFCIIENMCPIVNKLLSKCNPIYKYDNFSNKIADTFQTLEVRMFFEDITT